MHAHTTHLCIHTYIHTSIYILYVHTIHSYIHKLHTHMQYRTQIIIHTHIYAVYIYYTSYNISHIHNHTTHAYPRGAYLTYIQHTYHTLINTAHAYMHIHT